MDLTSLQELKKKLLHEKVLAPVWSFFLDHFGDHPEFIAAGEQTTDPFLEAVIKEIARQLFPRTPTVNSILLTRIAEQQFIHGGLFVGGRPGGVFYFEDARAGLMAVADLPPSIETKYTRFSGSKFVEKGKPSRN